MYSSVKLSKHLCYLTIVFRINTHPLLSCTLCALCIKTSYSKLLENPQCNQNITPNNPSHWRPEYSNTPIYVLNVIQGIWEKEQYRELCECAYVTHTIRNRLQDMRCTHMSQLHMCISVTYRNLHMCKQYDIFTHLIKLQRKIDTVELLFWYRTEIIHVKW